MIVTLLAIPRECLADARFSATGEHTHVPLAGQPGQSATAAAKRRRTLTGHETLIGNTNRKFPGLVTFKPGTSLADDMWQCNLCKDKGKPPTFSFGRGDALSRHHEMSPHHMPVQSVTDWCAARANQQVPTYTVDDAGTQVLNASQRSLTSFFQRAPVQILETPRRAAETFEGHMARVAVNRRLMSPTDRQAIQRVLCNGFTPATISIVRDGRWITAEVDPLRRDNSNGPKNGSFRVDPSHKFMRADGSYIQGTFFSAQCVGPGCTVCQNLDRNCKAFQDAVYENSKLEKRGLKRGERRASEGFQLGRLNRGEIIAGISEERKRRDLLRLRLWCKLNDTRMRRDTLTRNLEQMSSLRRGEDHGTRLEALWQEDSRVCPK